MYTPKNNEFRSWKFKGWRWTTQKMYQVRCWECRQTRLWKSLLKKPQVWKASGMRMSAAWQVGPYPPCLNDSPDSQIWVCLDQVLNRGACSSLEIPNYQTTKKNRIAADSTGICWRWQVGLSFNKNWWNRITVLLLINGEVLGKHRGW